MELQACEYRLARGLKPVQGGDMEEKEDAEGNEEKRNTDGVEGKRHRGCVFFKLASEGRNSLCHLTDPMRAEKPS